MPHVRFLTSWVVAWRASSTVPVLRLVWFCVCRFELDYFVCLWQELWRFTLGRILHWLQQGWVSLLTVRRGGQLCSAHRCYSALLGWVLKSLRLFVGVACLRWLGLCDWWVWSWCFKVLRLSFLTFVKQTIVLSFLGNWWRLRTAWYYNRLLCGGCWFCGSPILKPNKVIVAVREVQIL